MKTTNQNHPRNVQLTTLLRRATESHLASALLLFVLFWMAAAAGFSGSIGKWALRDGHARFGIERMLDATAHRPFVYRQLAPQLANWIDRHAPDRLKDRVAKKVRPAKIFARVDAAMQPEIRFRYVVVYYLTFLALFASLFVLRTIAQAAGAGRIAAMVAPVLFALAFPYLQTGGGYYYDTMELLFMSLAVLLALRDKALLLVACVLPATLNKETFIFFLPALYPLLRLRSSRWTSCAWLAVAIGVAGVVNLLLKLAFIEAPGGVGELHLLENLVNYLSPATYVRIEATYGVLGTGGMSLAALAVLLVILLRGWRACPAAIRQHLLIAAAINLPLFLVCGKAGELRNLSLLYVGSVVLIAKTIERAGEEARKPPPTELRTAD